MRAKLVVWCAALSLLGATQEIRAEEAAQKTETTSVSAAEPAAAAASTVEKSAKPKAKKKKRVKAKAAQLPATPKAAEETVAVATLEEDLRSTAQDSVTTAAAATEGAADSGLTSQASSSSMSMRERFTGNLMAETLNSTFEAVDGTAGEGSNLLLVQYLALGYKLDSRWKLGATQYWTNTIRDNSAGKRNLEFYDPYVTLSNNNIWSNEAQGLKLSGYIRYYVPISHESADDVGRINDQKNGKFRAKIDPSKTFMDGALTAYGTTFVYRALPGSEPLASTPYQRDWYVWFYPRVSYKVTPTLSPYLGYSNVLTHYRGDKTRNGGGRWQKWNNDHQIEFGLEWQALASFYLQPYVKYNPELKLKDTSVAIIADWAFL